MEEADLVESKTTPRTPVIYETVRRSGEDEMERPAASLWWSGLAAGLSISFSMLVPSVLHMHLPDTPWRLLITTLGYPIGFLIVVLGRQQLFTENTLTVVLPVVTRFSWPKLGKAGRLWAIVLTANLCGTFISALFCTYTDVIRPELRDAILEYSRHSVLFPPMDNLLRGITAGYLMAALVWLMPAAGGSPLLVVTIITYVIGVSGTAHVVAGSVEAFMLVLAGELSPVAMATTFALPALVGNIIGGTALFALLSYAQVRHEIDGDGNGKGR